MRRNIWISLILLFAGCSEENSAGGETKAGKTETARKRSVTIGIAQEPDTLFLPFKEMMASEEVARVGNYSLTRFNEKRQIEAWVAKTIPTLENGDLELFEEDGEKKMRATWHLRADVFWSDGKPLTADDYVFTHEIFTDPDQEIIDRDAVDRIEKMEAQGENRKTLVVTWKHIYAFYHAYRQHTAVPKHIVEPLYRKDRLGLKKHAFGTKPVMAGPFYIAEWVPGSHIIARKNPYAQGIMAPKLDEIVYRIIPQTNTMEANIVSGTIDIISPLGLTLDQGLELQKRIGDRFDVHFTEGLVWEHIDFDLRNPILKDKRVRQALAHGANRQSIVDVLFQGKQKIAHGTEPPQSIYYNDQVRKYPFDKAKAEALLEEAGYKKGKDGIRRRGGRRLSLPLMTTSGNKTREQVQVLLQSQWREIGVEILIKNQPAKVFFGETLRHRGYRGMAMFAWNKDPLLFSHTLWRCDNIPSKENRYRGQNQPAFCNEEVDALFDEGTRTLDEKRRIEIGKRVEEILAEELPALPLYFRSDVSVTKKRFKGWKPTGTLQAVSWNAYEWHWD